MSLIAKIIALTHPDYPLSYHSSTIQDSYDPHGD
jgi:hypothetical protein